MIRGIGLGSLLLVIALRWEPGAGLLVPRLLVSLMWRSLLSVVWGLLVPGRLLGRLLIGRLLLVDGWMLGRLVIAGVTLRGWVGHGFLLLTVVRDFRPSLDC